MWFCLVQFTTACSSNHTMRHLNRCQQMWLVHNERNTKTVLLQWVFKLWKYKSVQHNQNTWNLFLLTSPALLSRSLLYSHLWCHPRTHLPLVSALTSRQTCCTHLLYSALSNLLISFLLVSCCVAVFEYDFSLNCSTSQKNEYSAFTTHFLTSGPLLHSNSGSNCVAGTLLPPSSPRFVPFFSIARRFQLFLPSSTRTRRLHKYRKKQYFTYDVYSSEASFELLHPKKKVCACVRLILVLVRYVLCTRYVCTWYQPAEMRWGTERQPECFLLIHAAVA